MKEDDISNNPYTNPVSLPSQPCYSNRVKRPLNKKPISDLRIDTRKNIRDYSKDENKTQPISEHLSDSHAKQKDMQDRETKDNTRANSK